MPHTSSGKRLAIEHTPPTLPIQSPGNTNVSFPVNTLKSISLVRPIISLSKVKSPLESLIPTMLSISLPNFSMKAADKPYPHLPGLL